MSAGPGFTNYTVHDPGTTSLQALVYTVADQGLYTPMIIEPKSTGGGLSAKAVLDPVTVQPNLPEVDALHRAITTTTDEIVEITLLGMLPPLVANAEVSVEVISTPADFRRFLIRSTGAIMQHRQVFNLNSAAPSMWILL